MTKLDCSSASHIHVQLFLFIYTVQSYHCIYHMYAHNTMITEPLLGTIDLHSYILCRYLTPRFVYGSSIVVNPLFKKIPKGAVHVQLESIARIPSVFSA